MGGSGRCTLNHDVKRGSGIQSGTVWGGAPGWGSGRGEVDDVKRVFHDAHSHHLPLLRPCIMRASTPACRAISTRRQHTQPAPSTIP
jgi:hypothetical protein